MDLLNRMSTRASKLVKPVHVSPAKLVEADRKDSETMKRVNSEELKDQLDAPKKRIRDVKLRNIPVPKGQQKQETSKQGNNQLLRKLATQIAFACENQKLEAGSSSSSWNSD